jgi:PKD repeat protein
VPGDSEKKETNLLIKAIDMKKNVLSLVLLLTFHFSSSAQWNEKSYAGGQNFNCVNYFSSTNIWLGTVSFMLKSANGVNWTPVHTYDSNNNWIPSNTNSIAVIDSTTTLATGLLHSGNREDILITKNGGTNWNSSFYELAMSSPQYLNSIDLFSTRGIAVGNNGHIARSEDSGNSWNIINKSSGLLRDVKFLTFDTVIAVGENLIVRSVDGGASWTWTSQTGSFKNVTCVNNLVYIGIHGNTMLKSVDRGTTFTTLNLPFNYQGVLYLVDKNTLLAAGTDGIYISGNDGITWGKYILPSYKQIKMFDFLTPSNGIAVGEGGYIIKTDNLNGAVFETQTPSFTIQNGPKFCEGDSVKLANATIEVPGNAYEWKLDGTTFSTGYHAAVKISTAGTHTITLTLSDNTGGIPVSSSDTVIVKGHTQMDPINYMSVNDTTCPKNVVGFTLQRSKIGVEYQLRKGFVNVGPRFIGNDSLLRFLDSIGIMTSTLYNIKAIQHGCYTDSISTSKMVYVQNNQLDVAACIPPKKQCYDHWGSPGINRVTFNGINHASTTEINNYFDYSCCYQTDVEPSKGYDLIVRISGFVLSGHVRAWIDYNNDGVFSTAEQVLSTSTNDMAFKNVVISPSAITNKYIRMRIKADRDSADINNACRVNCGQIEDYAIRVPVVVPVANFTKTVTLVNCIPQVALKNTSKTASSYVWDFGDGTPTSNLVNPTHDYTASGTYTVTLTASNSSASNTTSQTVTVTVPQVPKPAVCVPKVTPIGIATLIAMQIDTTVLAMSGGSLYTNYTCARQLHLRAGQIYNFKLTPRNTNECSLFGIWLDYNNDGAFTEEEALTNIPNSQDLCYGTPVFFTRKIKETPNTNIPLRMRVVVYQKGWPVVDGCNSGEIIGGEVDDFTVFIDPILPVKADFDVDNKIVCSNDWLRCINKSTYATHYLWDFGDGETDTTEAPFSHHYKQVGTYTIKLKVFNSISVDSITKVNYVNAVQAPDKPSITLNGKTLVTSALADKYHWTNMDSVILKGTAATFNPPSDANYQLVVSNNYGCTNYNNFAYFPVHPEFTFKSTTACNDPAWMIFETIPKNTDYTVTWGDGSSNTYPRGSGLPYHYYTTAGTFTVKIAGCNDLGCDSLIRPNYITIHPKLPVPVIVENAGILSTPAVASGYQWYSGAEIWGETSSSFQPMVFGNYKVVVKSDKGCGTASDEYHYYPVRAVFNTDATSFCGVSNATVVFANTSTNATKYTWDFGDGTTSSSSSPDHTYSSPGLYTVKLKACDSQTCDSLVKSNYIRIYSTPFTAGITPQGTVTICKYDTVVLKAQQLAGASYKWFREGLDLFTGGTEYAVYRWKDGNYNVVVTDNLNTGCSASSEVVSVIVDENCVWPGDANNDNGVNHLDLLPVGLHYGETGTARSGVSDLWKAYPCVPWGILQDNGKDMRYVDCNGDGIISYKDTVAIHNNAALDHPLAPLPDEKPKQGSPVLYFKTASTNYLPGSWVTADIIAGDAATPASNLYGIGFIIDYDQSLIEPGTASINFPQGWFVQNATALTFSNIETVQDRAFVAATAIDHQNKSGYGRLATLRFKTKNSIAQSAELRLGFIGLTTNDAAGDPITMAAENHVITIDPIITGIDEVVAVSDLNIYPNPYTDKTIIAYSVNKKSKVTLEVYSALGQKLETLLSTLQAAGDYQHSFSAADKGYSKGVYFIKLTIDGASVLKRIVEL